jgi:hypothetical protein
MVQNVALVSVCLLKLGYYFGQYFHKLNCSFTLLTGASGSFTNLSTYIWCLCKYAVQFKVNT